MTGPAWSKQAKIRARLKETSESWIMAIYLVMNLVKLVQTGASFFIAALFVLSCRTVQHLKTGYEKLSKATGPKDHPRLQIIP